MIEAELGLSWDSLPLYCPLGPFKETLAGQECFAKVTSIVRQERKLHHLLEIEGKGALSLANSHRLGGIHVSPYALSREHYLGIRDTPICSPYKALSETSCFLIREEAKVGYVVWNVICRSRIALRALTRELGDGGVDSRVLSVKKINGSKRLTGRQVSILRLAFERGFFESPHATGVRELAKEMQCSPSTLVRLLRKGERKVLSDWFEVNRDLRSQDTR